MKRSVAIILSLLLLLSNMSITLNTHFCQGHAVKHSVSLGSDQSLSCGMPADLTPCESEEPGLNKLACCSNEYTSLDVDDNDQPELTELNLIKHLIAIPPACLSSSQAHFDVDPIRYSDYSPPPLIEDIQITQQVFLI